ncbi:hypothetical protein K0M31_012367 [Melipona bicolor]|uniref:Uncharacterized protein n=1 Tax=Melipona bicolor TaxID=60889 RepID=A0AA40FJR1_9HYME|nr:hypothetical protein K0M31_012367 [Melipona bicolor]
MKQWIIENLIFIIDGILLVVDRRHDPGKDISCTNKLFLKKNRYLDEKTCSYRIFVALEPPKTNYRKDCTYTYSRMTLIVIAINTIRRQRFLDNVRYYRIIIFQRVFNKKNIFI